MFLRFFSFFKLLFLKYTSCSFGASASWNVNGKKVGKYKVNVRNVNGKKVGKYKVNVRNVNGKKVGKYKVNVRNDNVRRWVNIK